MENINKEIIINKTIDSKDLSIATKNILNDFTLLDVKKEKSLIDLTNIFFNNLINDISNENIKRELAFTQNRLINILLN